MAINFKPSQAGLDKHLEGEHLEEAGLEHLPHLQEQLLDLLLRQQGDLLKLRTNEWRVTVRSRYPACHQEFCIMLYINFQPRTRLQRLSSILPAVCSVSGLTFRKLPSFWRKLKKIGQINPWPFSSQQQQQYAAAWTAWQQAQQQQQQVDFTKKNTWLHVILASTEAKRLHYIGWGDVWIMCFQQQQQQPQP